jgi:hypothetical protein
MPLRCAERENGVIGMTLDVKSADTHFSILETIVL